MSFLVKYYDEDFPIRFCVLITIAVLGCRKLLFSVALRPVVPNIAVIAYLYVTVLRN